jgi:DNA-binding SARP family transcriptional activator
MTVTSPSQKRHEVDAPTLRLFLFGEPQLDYNGVLLNIDRRKIFALLAYLALAKHRQKRETIASFLWPDLDQEHALAALRTTLSALTTVAPGDWLDKERQTLALHHDSIWIDVIAFQTLLNDARAHRHENGALCDECSSFLNSAIKLYRADFMSGFSIPESNDYDDWLMMQREWLRREFSYGLRRLADSAGEAGDFETALAHANQWLALDHLDESAHRMLMRLYAANGQRAAAVRQYQQCVEILDNELATPPEDETNQLYAAIMAEGALPFTPASASGRKTSILPALPPLVVGREQALNDIKARLGITGEMRPITVIQGWPGVGKSTTTAMLAHDEAIADCFPDGVLWTSLGETPNLLSELSVWATALGLRIPESERKIESISAQLAAALHDRRMLLIVDDVWKVEHAMPFKAGGQACATVMTSRLNDIAEALAPTAHDLYRLSVLAEDAAVELLCRLTPETVADHPAESRELVRDLEGLPLAIQVAGRLLHAEARLGWGVSSLLQDLRAGATILDARVPGDLMRLDQATSPTIAALLRKSTDALDYEMQQRFAVLGVFVPKPATFDLGAMAVAWGVDDPKPFARILVNRGLLEPVSAGRFQMHALLVLHAHTLLEQAVP